MKLVIVKSILFAFVTVQLAALASAHAQRMCSDLFRSEVPAVKSYRKVPQPSPVDPKVIQERANKAWQGGLREKVKLLNAVHRELYWEFPGMEPQVDQIMANIKQRVLFNDLVKGGGVDSLVGFSGYAKSDMMNRLCALTGARCVMVKVRQGLVDVSADLLRSMADVPTDGKQVPLAILVFDEWQNFKKSRDLDEGAKPVGEDGTAYHNPSGGSTVVNEKVLREKFVRTLVDMYGTGEMKVDPTRSAADYASNIAEHSRSINSAVKEHTELTKLIDSANSKLATAGEDEKENIRHSIKQLERNMQNQVSAIDYHEKQLKDQILEFVGEWGPALSEYQGKAVSAIADMFLENPNRELEYVTTTLVGRPYQKTLTFKQLVTVITANPEATIKRFNQKLKVTDPDAIRQMAAQIPVEEIRKELFDDIFEGSAAIAGLRRRLNIDNMQMILPFGKEQLDKLVSRQVEKIQRAFKHRIEEVELSGLKLEIDDSVKALLIAEGVAPNGGPGMYFGREKILIGNFLSDFTDDIITRSLENPEAARIEVLRWSLNSQREFVITGIANGRVVYEERAAVRRIEDQNIKSEVDMYEVRKNFAAKAGEIITGMALFGSLPLSTQLDGAHPERWSLNGLWNPPQKQRFSRSEDFIRVALGAVSAKNIMSDGFDQTLSDPHLKFAHETLLSMVAQLRQREERYDYLVDSSGKDSNKAYERQFPIPMGISTEVFKALQDAADADSHLASTVSNAHGAEDGGKASEQEQSKLRSAQASALNRALRFLHRDTEQIISQNSELLSELIQLMEKKYVAYQSGRATSAELTSGEILQLVEKNYLYSKRTHKLKAWLIKVLRIKSNRPNNLILPEDVRASEIGSVSVSENPLIGPDESIMKRKMWKKLWYWMTRRLESQRPFRAL